jgi:hypothetical protein
MVTNFRTDIQNQCLCNTKQDCWQLGRYILHVELRSGDLREDPNACNTVFEICYLTDILIKKTQNEGKYYEWKYKYCLNLLFKFW